MDSVAIQSFGALQSLVVGIVLIGAIISMIKSFITTIIDEGIATAFEILARSIIGIIRFICVVFSIGITVILLKFASIITKEDKDTITIIIISILLFVFLSFCLFFIMRYRKKYNRLNNYYLFEKFSIENHMTPKAIIIMQSIIGFFANILITSNVIGLLTLIFSNEVLKYMIFFILFILGIILIPMRLYKTDIHDFYCRIRYFLIVKIREKQEKQM